MNNQPARSYDTSVIGIVAALALFLGSDATVWPSVTPEWVVEVVRFIGAAMIAVLGVRAASTREVRE